MNVSDELFWCTICVALYPIGCLQCVSMVCLLTANDTEISWILYFTHFHCICTIMHILNTDHVVSVIIL